jgi:hypothetical protein
MRRSAMSFPLPISCATEVGLCLSTHNWSAAVQIRSSDPLCRLRSNTRLRAPRAQPGRLARRWTAAAAWGLASRAVAALQSLDMVLPQLQCTGKPWQTDHFRPRAESSTPSLFHTWRSQSLRRPAQTSEAIISAPKQGARQQERCLRAHSLRDSASVALHKVLSIRTSSV